MNLNFNNPSSPVNSFTTSNTAIVHIHSSLNNTIVNVTDLDGNCLIWSSGGKVKSKGARKALPFTAAKIGNEIAQYLVKSNITSINIVIKGIGYGRENALRAMNLNGIKINSITDATPIPHNGCKPQKRSRK